MQLLMEPATYLSQQISARTHTKPIRHAPAVGPKRTWQWHWKWRWKRSWSWNCVWMLSMRSAQLSPVGSNRIGIGVAWQGGAMRQARSRRCNKVLNHWGDINPKLWHTLSMQCRKTKANQSEPHMLRLSTPKRISFVSAPTTTGPTIELGGPLSICLTSHQLMKAQ